MAATYPTTPEPPADKVMVAATSLGTLNGNRIGPGPALVIGKTTGVMPVAEIVRVAPALGAAEYPK